MPILQKIFTLEISPEKFIDSCSDVELQEVFLLADAKLSRRGAIPVPATQIQAKALPAGPEPAQRAPRKRGWTDEDDAKLRELWPTCTGAEATRALKRNYKTVASRAIVLGLRKRKPSKNSGPVARQGPELVPPPPHFGTTLGTGA
jgi:hypothetical protein